MANKIEKAASIQKQAVTDSELALINQQSLRELTADEVFPFRISACNNEVDRDFEQFTDAALEGLAKLYIGKPILADHNWSAAMQTARIYASGVAPTPDGTGKRLVLRAYMLKNNQSQPTIDAIEGGILREVSVGCALTKAICGICGVNKVDTYCQHRRGQEYDGKTCVVSLDAPSDAYEVSFVAVPAQPAAGVVKRYGGEDKKPTDAPQESKHAETDEKIRVYEAKLKFMKIEEDCNEQENA